MIFSVQINETNYIIIGKKKNKKTLVFVEFINLLNLMILKMISDLMIFSVKLS